MFHQQLVEGCFKNPPVPSCCRQKSVLSVRTIFLTLSQVTINQMLDIFWWFYIWRYTAPWIKWCKWRSREGTFWKVCTCGRPSASSEEVEVLKSVSGAPWTQCLVMFSIFGNGAKHAYGRAMLTSVWSIWVCNLGISVNPKYQDNGLCLPFNLVGKRQTLRTWLSWKIMLLKPT